ncbi:MAG: LacI family DNA-binding transcriptional regulator [Verrucomicrobiota bacterium]|nr:LacI family DNA-binding transcriptional regulator [Verrucomicrobiota bacterium]
MVNLRDIAEKADVSRMTVSLALRGDPRVAAATRERVRKIAKEMGYKPNPKIATLMSEVAKTHHVESGEHLAFLTSHRTEDGWKQWDHSVKCFEGARERAAEYGYVLEPCWVRDAKCPPGKLVHRLWSRGIKGCLVASLGTDMLVGDQRTLDFDWSRFAVVELDETLDTPKLTCARHDHFNGMLLLLHALESLGYRRMGLTMSRETEMRTRHRWYAAYMLWKETRGFKNDLPILFSDTHNGILGKKWVLKNRIDAVVSVDAALFDLLQDEGISIPEEVGFCVLDRPEMGDCSLSGIGQNPRLIGQSAMDILVGLVRRGERGVPNHPSQWICNGQWIAGSSTQRVGDPLDEQPLYDSHLVL